MNTLRRSVFWTTVAFAPAVVDSASRQSHSFLHSRHADDHHGHHRHPHAHKNGSKHKGSPAPVYEVAPANQTVAMADPSLSFHSAHPTVERELGNMGQQLQDLENQKAAVANISEAFEASTAESTEHMSEATALQHVIRMKKEQMMGKDRAVKKLAAEEIHLKNNSVALDKKLHVIMNRKVAAAAGRLQHQQMIEINETQVLNNLTTAFTTLNASAEAALAEKEAAVSAMKDADAALQEAQQAQIAAATAFVAARNQSDEQVNELQTVSIEFKAQQEKVNRTHDFVVKSEHAVVKMQSILGHEEQRVKMALADGQKKLMNRINQTELAKFQLQSELLAAQANYSAWQAAEKMRAEETSMKKKDYEQSLQAYAEKRAQILDTANAKAVERATNRSNYSAGDDWAWGAEDGDVNLVNAAPAAAPAAEETAAEPAVEEADAAPAAEEAAAEPAAEEAAAEPAVEQEVPVKEVPVLAAAPEAAEAVPVLAAAKAEPTAAAEGEASAEGEGEGEGKAAAEGAAEGEAPAEEAPAEEAAEVAAENATVFEKEKPLAVAPADAYVPDAVPLHDRDLVTDENPVIVAAAPVVKVTKAYEIDNGQQYENGENGQQDPVPAQADPEPEPEPAAEDSTEPAVEAEPVPTADVSAVETEPAATTDDPADVLPPLEDDAAMEDYKQDENGESNES